MLKKTIEKQKRKERPNQWVGLYTRKTPTKKEKENKINKKYVNKYTVDKYIVDKY